MTDDTSTLLPLPPQPAGVPWPTLVWPERSPHELADVDAERLSRLLDRPFGDSAPPELGLTHAVVVVHGGTIVGERYGAGFHSALHELAGHPAEPIGPDTPLISWSMAKSILQVAIGVLVRDGRVAVEQPVPVPEWHEDERRAITWGHMLHMAGGLAWVEEYVADAGSDVVEMLFGAGAADMAAFAARLPAATRPGTRFLYSSGTTNILARATQRVLGVEGDAAGMGEWLRRELFDPIGMTSADPRFDEAGTFIASSYVYATARDFARLGLLVLRGGAWDGRQLVDPGWVDYARAPIALPTDHPCGYGAHWWVHDDGLGTFAAHGYEGQRITCVPARDLVVVRLGKTPSPDDPMAPRHEDRYIDEIIDCFGS